MTENRAAQIRRERHETPTEQLDRNWADLLQELRVVQTGVQSTALLITPVALHRGLFRQHARGPLVSAPAR